MRVRVVDAAEAVERVHWKSAHDSLLAEVRSAHDDEVAEMRALRDTLLGEVRALREEGESARRDASEQVQTLRRRLEEAEAAVLTAELRAATRLTPPPPTRFTPPPPPQLTRELRGSPLGYANGSRGSPPHAHRPPHPTPPRKVRPSSRSVSAAVRDELTTARRKIHAAESPDLAPASSYSDLDAFSSATPSPAPPFTPLHQGRAPATTTDFASTRRTRRTIVFALLAAIMIGLLGTPLLGLARPSAASSPDLRLTQPEGQARNAAVRPTVKTVPSARAAAKAVGKLATTSMRSLHDASRRLQEMPIDKLVAVARPIGRGCASGIAFGIVGAIAGPPIFHVLPQLGAPLVQPLSAVGRLAGRHAGVVAAVAKRQMAAEAQYASIAGRQVAAEVLLVSRHVAAAMGIVGGHIGIAAAIAFQRFLFPAVRQLIRWLGSLISWAHFHMRHSDIARNARRVPAALRNRAVATIGLTSYIGLGMIDARARGRARREQDTSSQQLHVEHDQVEVVAGARK